MLNVLTIARKYKLIIIADEIYWKFIFNNVKYYSFYELTKNVPIITVCGASKTYLVPGWRFGWCIIHDPTKYKFKNGGILNKVKPVLWKLSVLSLGVNRPLQKAFIDILNKVPNSYINSIKNIIESQSIYLYNLLINKHSKYIRPIKPKGAMYIMCELKLSNFKDIKNDHEFVHKFKDEQNVFVLPGYIFNMKG